MRTFNRIASLVLGLLLIVGGLLVVVESMLAAYRHGPWLLPSAQWYETLRGTRLGDRPVVLVALALALAGLALLIAELRHWPPRRLPVRPGAVDTATEHAGTAEAAESADWWLLRRPAERRLARAVTELPGVRAVRVRLDGRERWTINVLAQAREESRASIEAAVDAELARLCAPAPARVRVRLRTPRRVT